jgi:thiamine-phosphate pyrophosphorylase
VRTAARRRGHILLVAGDRRMAINWQADGCHNGSDRLSHGPIQIRTAAVHNVGEMHRANRRRVDIVLLSPVYPTRSHPGQRPLSATQIRRLMALSHAPVILLGGMTRQRFARWKSSLAYGWAGIDGLS